MAAVPMRGTALRDLQARERTFLSYIRTAGYCFLVGMGIRTLFQGSIVRVAAVVFVAAGLVLTVVGCVSFTRFCVGIRKDVYREMSGAGAWVITVVALLVAAVTVALLVEGG